MKNAKRRRNRNLALLALLSVVAYFPALACVLIGGWPGVDDAISLFNVWRHLGREGMHAGVILLWNPYYFCGMPLYANNQSALLYWPNIIYWFLPMAWALLLDLILHDILLAWGAYFLGRAVQLSRTSSFLIALAFSLGSAVSAHAYNGHFTWHAVRAYLPWELALLVLYLRTGSWRYAVGLAVCFAFQVGAGYPPLVLLSATLCCGVVVAWVITYRTMPRGWPGTVALVVALAGSLSAICVLPLADISRLSVHGDSLSFEFAAQRSGSWTTLARLMVPGFFGGNSPMQWSTAAVPHEECAYIGLVPLLLALGAPLWARRGGQVPRAVWFLMALLPFAVIMAMGKNLPLYRIVFDVFPPLRQTRVPVRWMELFYYASAILCGLSYEALIHRRCAGVRAEQAFTWALRLVTAGFLVLLCFVLLMPASTSLWMQTAQAVVKPKDYAERVAVANQFQSVALLEALVCFSLAAASVLLWKRWRVATDSKFVRRRERELVLVIVADLLGVFWRSAQVIPPEPLHKYFTWPHTLTNHYHSGDRWETALAYSLLNHSAFYGIPIFNGYDALGQKRYFQFVEAQEQSAMYAALYEVNNHTPLLRVASVTHTLTSPQDKAPKIHPAYPKFRPRLVGQEGVFHLWQWEGAWPRTYLTRNVQAVPEEKQLPLLQKLAGGNFEEQHRPAVVSPNTFSRFSGEPIQSGESVLSWNESFDSVTVSTHTAKPSLLVYTGAHSPGWKAYVNGQATPIYYANFLFRGVEVPTGDASVHMIYEPQSFRLGAFFSLCGLMALSAMGAAQYKRRIKPVKVSSPDMPN